MDANGKIRRMKGTKGISLVVVALLIVILVVFVGIAVDIGYMYVTKGQLQNAADSAALAGGGKMKSVGTGNADPTDTVQTAARNEATTFAATNKAAGTDVAIANDNSNTLSPGNDIAVGNWNGTAFTTNSTPVNAIEVRTRRTTGSPGGQVDVFFSKVLNAIGMDWSRMSAAATATAALPLRASGYIALCQDTCSGVSSDPSNPTPLSPPLQYDRMPGSPGTISFAWTSLLNNVSSVPQISPYICTDTPYIDVCNSPIWTTQGTASSLFKDMEGAFNDPTFDRANKEPTSGNNITAWWLIVPVVQSGSCNPGNQPIPVNVWGYALVRVISVCDTGGGQPCRPYESHPCSYPHKVVIDRIACIDCAAANSSPGFKAVLVK